MKWKKIGKLFTSKFVGTGPSSYKNIIYRAAVSQRLRNTTLRRACFTLQGRPDKFHRKVWRWQAINISTKTLKNYRKFSFNSLIIKLILKHRLIIYPLLFIGRLKTLCKIWSLYMSTADDQCCDKWTVRCWCAATLYWSKYYR